MNNIVIRPWGTYKIIESGLGYLVKIIIVNPNKRLSLQYHNHRKEHWFVLSGQAIVFKGTQDFILNCGENVDIDCLEYHRLENKQEIDEAIIRVRDGEKPAHYLKYGG